jgi:hypothetical protein
MRTLLSITPVGGMTNPATPKPIAQTKLATAIFVFIGKKSKSGCEVNFTTTYYGEQGLK